MKKKLLLLAAVIGMGAFMNVSGADEKEVCLITGGVPNLEIILPEKPLSVESFAAKELNDHLKLICGHACDIVPQATGTKLPVRLGRAAKVSIDDLKANSARIRIAADGIDIAGVDGSGDALNLHTAGGTMFGVYDLLEYQFGVRWLWQGDLGTTYEKFTELRVPASTRDIHPLVFSCWRVSPNTGAERWAKRENFDRFHKEECLWMRRHRFALADTLNRGHAFTVWYERYHKDHPDWFNLLPNGKRDVDPFYGNASKQLISMCVSNPGFVEKIIEEWQKRDVNDIINANENDTAGKCTCPRCLASDGLGHDDERLAQAKARFEARDPQWWKPLGSLSDRYAKYYMAVLREGKKINPKCRVIAGTYANRNDPPLHTKLCEDIVLRTTPPIMYPWTQEKVKEFKDNWKGWADTGAKIMFRPNFTLDGHNFPLMYYKFFASCYDFAVANGLDSVDMDSFMGMAAANGITNYVIAMKTNEPHRTVEELEDEYCAAFGKAKDIMKQYIANFETATAKGFVAKDSGRIEGGNYAEFIFDAHRVFTKEVMDRGFDLLKQAEAADGDPIVRRRIAFLRTGLTDCQYVLDSQAAYDDYKKTGNAMPFAKAYRKLLDFRNDNEASLYQNRSYAEGFEARLWPRHFLSLLNEDETEIKNWKIRFDPDKRGVNEKWFLGEAGAEWEPIVLDKHWQYKPIGERWRKEHDGNDYHGVGWYKASFRAKDTGTGQKVELKFWAVDGEPVVYLNGEIILTQHPVRDMRISWLTPFTVDVTGKLKDGENLIAIRLDKTLAGPRGVYKSVVIKTGKGNPKAAVPLPEKWNLSVMYGNFRTPETTSFPLTLTSLKADETKLAYKGVWARFWQSIPVSKGSTYEIQSHFVTPKGFTGSVEFWVRSSPAAGLDDGNKNVCFLSTEGKEQLCRFRFKASQNTCRMFLTLTNGIGTVQFKDLTVTPILSSEP